MKFKSTSISKYKSELNKILKKNKIKKNNIPDNVEQLEKDTGFYRNEYCKIVEDCESLDGEKLYSGTIGKVYAPYRKDKIVIVLYKLHKPVAVNPIFLSHYKTKKEKDGIPRSK